MFNGIGVSRGYGIGEAQILERDQPEVSEKALAPDSVEAEIERFQEALETARLELRTVLDLIPRDTPGEIEAFIESHLMMLDDPMLLEGPRRLIREHTCNAEWALKLQRDAIVAVFDAMDDEYLRTRRDDVDHVIRRIRSALYSRPSDGPEPATEWRGRIVVADDLTPADTVQMQNQGVAGFVTESGGQLSHTAILARSLGIPAVVGVHEVRRYVANGERIIIDGESGLVVASPDEHTVQRYRQRQRALRRRIDELVGLRHAPAATLDGNAVTLQANIEIEEDIAALARVNAAGVGLYRTEFMYMNRADVPGEEEHYETYISVVRALNGAPLTIRTVDIGADKEIAEGQIGPLAHNPAMGLRGIRRCLIDPSLFVPQLRAILRASAKGPINIMFPMLTNITEVHQALALLEDVKASLHREGQRFDATIPVGGMIEVPAAAVTAEAFARHLNFLSIGTNDLIQYSLAIDRIDDQVNYLYDPLHPAVLALIKLTIDAGRAAGIPVSMCGEMAGDARFTRLLLSLGLRDFSMPPNSVLEVRQVVNNTHLGDIESFTERILHCYEPGEQERLLAELNEGVGALTAARDSYSSRLG